MVKVKSFVPKNQRGEPLPQCFGEYIYFDIEFNFFRDVDRTPSAELRDRYEARVCECVLRLPESYSDTGEPTQLVIFCHGAGGRVCESEGTIGGLSQTAELFECGFAVLDFLRKHFRVSTGFGIGFLIVLACPVCLLGFSGIVRVLYSVFGYLGLPFLIILIFSQIKLSRKTKRSQKL